jgi:hypothetical protein
MRTKPLSSASGMTDPSATLKVCLLQNPSGKTESDVLPEREPGDCFLWRCPEVLASLCVRGLLDQPSLHCDRKRAGVSWATVAVK